ncbi:MAG TPA: hypothetical protein VKD72_38405 [Gemmataceae bacterium]|nr:hypothetical protein [Gemmataceae bacterium]
MGGLVFVVCLLALVVWATSERTGGPPPAPLAGWFGVFPEVPGYHRSFLAPVVAGGQPPSAYQQTARYDWTGGRWEVLWVTLTRDPALGPAGPGAALRAAGARPLPDPGPDWLVVPLGPEKTLVVEREGSGPDLREFVGGFDLAALAAALDRPPRTDFRRTPEAFRVFRRGVPFSDVVAWVGFADEDVGPDGHLLVYRLPDGGRVLLTFPDLEGLAGARLERPDGTGEDLAPLV